MSFSRKINKHALIEVLNMARPNAEPPPHTILTKYPRLYEGGTIRVDGIATVRIAEVMAKDHALATYFNGFLVAGGIRYLIGLEDFAQWLWTLYRANRNALAAVDKFESAIVSNTARARTCAILANVPLKAVIDVTPDIRVVPLAEIDESKVYKAFTKRWQEVGSTSEPSAVLVVNHRVSPLFLSAKEASTVTEPPEEDRRLLIEDIKNCLGLVGPCAPVVMATWTEFPDAEAPCPDDARWHNGAEQYLPPVAPLGVFDENRAKELLKQFLELKPEVRVQIRISLQRLNAALRQTYIVDRAIDLGVGLEALLLHDMDQSDGLRYRFALRGAVFLAPPGAERKAHFFQFRELYDLRSKAVHKGNITGGGAKLPDLPRIPYAAFLQDGARLCAALITTIIEHGRLPNWEDVILFNSADT